MAVKFTPEQQKVIDLRDRNILVSAAAGSGKTAVLVERIIRMITDTEHPVDIDRLLVVTFTNAAAAEMRERIGQAISRQLEKEPENTHLQKQASLLHNAQITTIHSFCLFIIRNNFNDVGLDPAFRVADEGELKLLKQDVLAELLEEAYQEKTEEFICCVEYFTGGNTDQLLEEFITRLYEFSMSYPWPEEWIANCAGDYKITDVIELENSDWCRFLIEYIHIICGQCVKNLDMALRICDRPDGPYMYAPLLLKEREMLKQLLKPDSLKAYYDAFEGISFGRLPSKKDDTINPACRDKVQQIRKEIKKQLEEIRNSYFLISPKQAVERMQKAAESVEELLRLVIVYKEKLDKKKRQENMIDFHDMEHLALHVLLHKDENGNVHPTEAAKEYRQHFHEILIDEYQDSNLVQEFLLKSISGEEEGHFNRFMVGDVKQSIYKFRLARPELFMEKYNLYSKDDSYSQRIDLHKNFRSRPQVLDSINRLFFQIMGKQLGGVEYDEEAALYPGAVYPEYEEGTKEQVSFYETEYIVIGKDSGSSLTIKEQEAEMIAGKIRDLYREFQVTDKNSGLLRPVRYSDIVILLRTTSGWAEEFKNILEKEGIPAYVSSQTGYFQAVEIKVLLQFLKIIDNPLQDIPLYGTLKSFFGGFSEEEIAGLRSKDKESSLFELLSSCQGDLREKVDTFLNMLSGYRRKSAYTPIHKLIQEILQDTGYLDYVTARPGGERRRANVEMLLTRAAAFENTSYYGLFHFLRYVEQLEKYEVDYGEADVLDENADVVRIMSIHKSKGLEFPVCFVSGLSKKFNMQDTSGRLIADIDLGVGVDYIDTQLRIKGNTLKKNAMALKMKLDALGEELRILYVAMTRAKEKLILTAMTPDMEKFKAQMEQKKEFQEQEKVQGEKITFSDLSGAGCYLDFILPCLSQVEMVEPHEVFFKDVSDATEETGRRQQLLTKVFHPDLVTDRENEIMMHLSDKFSRSYAYQYLSELFIKTTVSELKKKRMNDLPERSIESAEAEEKAQVRMENAFTQTLFEEPEIVPYIPSFIESREGMSGTDRGSAYHKVMELLDFSPFLKWMNPNENTEEKEGKREELARQLDQFVEEQVLEKRWRESVSLTKVEKFLKSALAYRMAKAGQEGKLKREQPFVLGLPANRLGTQFPEKEQVLIQGIIDVFFEEEGEIVVVDYKTDALSSEKELIGRYQVQLDYYGEALERLTGKKVKQKIIYSFALGKEIMLY